MAGSQMNSRSQSSASIGRMPHGMPVRVRALRIPLKAGPGRLELRSFMASVGIEQRSP
jgi:hypothetical protein